MRRAKLRSFTQALLIGGASIIAPTVVHSQPAPAPAGTDAPAPAAETPDPTAVQMELMACGESGGGSSGPGKIKQGAKPPPAPTKRQLKAFAAMQGEAKIYEKRAKDYKKTLTLIVRHHYEERRRRILSSLDREIKVESKNLDEARNAAIARLEEFISKYSGDNAHPVSTPDAMFRLAALYEEKGRADFDADLTKALIPAINLYRRIIAEYPNYEEIAAVYYYLGHAYTDSSRLDEAQQAWRALVCSNNFKVKPDPDDASKIALEPMDQDHDDKFWNDWYNKNPIPLDQVKGRKRRTADQLARADKDEELAFRDPYPDSCKPLPQDTPPGEDPRYIAEVWWQIGNFHFDQLDTKGGPYNLNRAVSAYEHSMKITKPPLYGVAMYKRAWTYFKQQRYKTAVEWFVKLLHYADDQEKRTGDPGADFRAEAYTYIAGSLTYVDFDGPQPIHPNIPRNDVLDTETDPVIAEQKMRIAIERVQDASLIPQDKPWTVEIYKALAQEFIEITQNRNAIEVLELTLQKFPMDRDAPVMQNKISELYDQVARLAPEGSAANEEYSAKALAARTKLAQYVGTTPWTNANRNDPEALQQAELLVRGGLKRAAADHTNNGKALFERGKAEGNLGLIEKAIAEYRLAETGWYAYLEQDCNSQDAYESKFWLADARYWIVVLQAAGANRRPKQIEIDRARAAATAVRDSNEDDEYLQPAAYYLVDLVGRLLEFEYKQYESSGGSEGIQKREEVEFTGEGENKKHVTVPLPPLVQQAIAARDAYNNRIPFDRDPEKNGLLYASQAADYNFLYGQFEEARKRYQPIYDKYCGKNQHGYDAWERLLSMANFEGKTDESRKLIEGKSCAFDDLSKKKEDGLRKPVKMGLAFKDAAKLFKEAEAMEPGPERNKKWRAAAVAYKVALEAAPDRNEAPEAAMNGAYAYKQVGEYDKAIEMYELFISKYGSEENLKKLEKEDPAEYQRRVKFLKDAYDALAGSYVLFFDYPKAAETFDKISSIERFEQKDRRDAAQQALSLYSSLGDAGHMASSKKRFFALGASPKEQAEAEFIVANSDMKKWDVNSPDEGANRAARIKATTAMSNYHKRFAKKAPAAQYAVEAAYNVARMKKAARSGDEDKWWKATIAAFNQWERLAPKKDGKSSALGSREANMGGEAEYTLIDKDLIKKFDYETGHHRYKGTVVQVVQEYRKQAGIAKGWYDKLGRIASKYVSPEWTIAAVARQGSVYDSLRTGLFNTRPPALKMFTAKQEKALKTAEESDNLDLQEKADAIRVKVQTAWRTTRDKELDSADQIVVDRYATAYVLGKRYNISNAATIRAVRRLAFLTDVIGEAKMKQFSAGVKDLNYTEKMFTRIRPGLVSRPPSKGMPRPLPVVIQ